MVSAAGVREAGEVLLDQDDHVSKAGLHFQKSNLGRCGNAAPDMSLATTAYGRHFARQSPMIDVFRQKRCVAPRRNWKEIRR